jgi:indole-3-glycerol phosphate synthase
MDILEQIVARKKAIVDLRRKVTPIPSFALSKYYARNVISLVERLKAEDSSGIIAEFKRRSPSKGIIHAKAEVPEVTKAYNKAGVAGLSVLTDTPFFSGVGDDLLAARAVNNIPILRKDFIVDEHQVYETKAMGADVMLLIAECLTKAEVKQLASLAKFIGLEIILEIHSEEQLDKYTSDIDIIGVNNRNLKTFEVSIEQSKQLFDKLPADVVKISESGISEVKSILELKDVGYQGFLIGENFMKTDHPGAACEEFIKQIRQ